MHAHMKIILPHRHSRTKVSKLPCDNVDENPHIGGVEHASCTAAAEQVQQEFGDGVWAAGLGYGHRVLWRGDMEKIIHNY